MSCKICGLKCNANELISCIQCERNVCVANCTKQCKQGSCSLQYCKECVKHCNICEEEIEICDASVCKYADNLKCTRSDCGLIHRECSFRCECCEEEFCSSKAVHLDEKLNKCSVCGAKVCNSCFIAGKGCAFYSKDSVLNGCDSGNSKKPYLLDACIDCVKETFYECEGCDKEQGKIMSAAYNIKMDKVIITQRRKPIRENRKPIPFKDVLVFCRKHVTACLCCGKFSCFRHSQKKQIGITLEQKTIGHKKADICDSCCFK